MRVNKSAAFAAALLGASLLLSGCASGPSTAGASSASSTKPLSIGFFGFAATNGFAQGTFLGVKEAAKAANATATFVDGAFDAQKQVQQVRDAITSKQFDVIVIQANDNVALQAPLAEAVAAGIKVVVEFSIVGPKFDTTEPQVKGAISIVDLPTASGKALAQLGKDACAKAAVKPCQVAYLEGFKALPLDNARTEAFKAELATDPSIKLVASVEGGYTADSGRAAFQNVLQANPNVNVVVGSSQAITGAAAVAGANSTVQFVGNGASQQNVDAVRNGKWFGIYVTDVVKNGKKATELGIAQARGESVQTATDEATLAPNSGKGTKATLDAADFKSGYSD